MGDLEKQLERGNGFEGEAEVGDEEKGLLLDFDMLCATVALQTQGRWKELNGDDDVMEGMEIGEAGVLRMWEGEVLDCFEDRRIAIETACCPCYRFGKNMKRAGFGPSFLQGASYFILTMGLFLCCVAFIITKRRCFVYTGVAVTILFGAYLGFFRTQIRKKFNIRGTDSSLDDCVYHLACPCCTLCQESRTLEMNNVQDGTWHGRGDTICVGSYNEGSTALFELIPPPLVSTKTPDLLTVEKDINSTGGS